MQFQPVTWLKYAQDGNSDGVKDPLNMHDNIAAAAYYFAIHQHKGVEYAILKYNCNNKEYLKKITKEMAKLQQ